MYIPKYAEVSEAALIHDFVRDHSFGALISGAGGETNANHYPFLLDVAESGAATLWTHLARSNPQWQEIAKVPQCLAVFTGPHAYISPTYYVGKLQVPTWSYTAVHARCEASVVTDDKLALDLMARLVKESEEANGTNWDYNLPEEFHSKLMKAILWLKLEVTAFEGKFKLSQNRGKGADYDGVVQAFKNRGSDNDRELLKYMKLAPPR